MWGSEQLAGDQVPIWWCFGSKKETPSTDGWAGIFKSLGYGLSFIREMSDLGVQIRTHAYLLATYSLIKSHSIRETMFNVSTVNIAFILNTMITHDC